MTTEAELHEMRQKAFNGAWRGLKSQGFEKSISNTLCAVRGDNDSPARRVCCAIGWLIPDSARPERVYADPRKIALSVLPALIDDDCEASLSDFGADLMYAHDDARSPRSMAARLRAVAAKWKLTVPA